MESKDMFKNNMRRANKQQNKPKPKKQQQQRAMFNQNSLNGSINRTTKTRVKQPRINNNNGAVIIAHKEFVTSIATSAAGLIQIARLRLNPGAEDTFPWLSSIAPSFETYKFRKLAFYCKTRCPTTTDGAIILSPDYDAADAAAVNERELAMNADAVEDSVSHNFRCAIKPERMNASYKQHYTASNARFESTSQDQKTLDVGFITVAVNSGNAAAVSYSKLWVEYEVELRTPQLVTIMPSGGVGSNKTSGLAVGASVFTNNAMNTLNQETLPIVEVLPASEFPGPNLFRVLRDWQGYVTAEATGTAITGLGGVRKNGVNIPTSISEIISSGSTRAMRQGFSDFRIGDLIGIGTTSAATLTGLVLNLGASSVI